MRRLQTSPQVRFRSRVTKAVVAVGALVLSLGAAPAATAQGGITGAVGGLDLGSINRTAQDVAGVLPPDVVEDMESDLWGGPPPEETPEAPYSEYVALGDSYAALGNLTSPADGPPYCGRTTTNYPSFIARSELVGTLVDASCGGAVTDDLFESQYPGVPPQLDALTPETELVSLSIGGNDMGFGEIVICAFSNAASPADSPCRDQLAGDISERLDELVVDLDEVYAEIADRSPEAQVVTTQYMRLLPETQVPCGFADLLGPGDFEWMNDLTHELNGLVHDTAVRNGHTSVMPDDEGVDRSGCAPSEEAWTSHLGLDSLGTPMHPTALGQAAMGAAVKEIL